MSRSDAPDPARVRDLVLRYGWNATAYQILNPGLHHWLTSDGDAVVGYVEAASGPVLPHRYWVAAGGPICSGPRVETVALAFEAAARSRGARVCWFGADARLRDVLQARPGHSAMRLGAQPVWDPAGWDTIVARKASLRAQLHRARNKGVAVRLWSSAEAQDHPALRRILLDWLSRRGLPPLHFLVEPHTLPFLRDRRVLVAERQGTPVAFLILTPVPARRGWLVEQLVQARTAPNGTAALLIDAAMRLAAESGSPYLTLGLSPLSPHTPPEDDEPLWLRALLGWVRAHIRRFYNFRGLDAFKHKFVPDRWDPITAIAQTPRPSPGTLYAIADAFAGSRTPERLIARAMLNAARQEAQTARAWLTDRGRRT